MRDDEKIVKTEEQLNNDIDIRHIDTMMQPKVEKDDEEILEVESDDTEVLEVEDNTEELDLASINDVDENTEILGEASVVPVVEPTGAYQVVDNNVDSTPIIISSTDINMVNDEDGSIIGVQEENVAAVGKVNNTIPRKYIDYKYRVAIMGVLLVIFFGLYLVFFVNALEEPEVQSINYRETSNVDYKVYLKSNDFYDSEYLDKDMVYVASLVDNIAVDFNYRFDITDVINMNLSYDVVGKLIISDNDGKKRYYEKEYKLLDRKKVDLSEVNNYNLKETILIDYDYYNGLANQFKTNYGVEAKSTLQIYLKVHKQSNDKGYNINADSIMSMTIPLSTKSVEIEMDCNDINENISVDKGNVGFVHNKFSMTLAIVFGLLMIFVAIKLVRFLSSTKVKKSVYDNYVEKILKEYDRLIVENFTGPDLKNSSVITIKNFDELLDVRDGLRLPILYYVIAKHQKCYFYVKNGNEVYLLTIKAVDLEKEKEKGMI